MEYDKEEYMEALHASLILVDTACRAMEQDFPGIIEQFGEIKRDVTSAFRLPRKNDSSSKKI